MRELQLYYKQILEITTPTQQNARLDFYSRPASYTSHTARERRAKLDPRNDSRSREKGQTQEKAGEIELPLIL